MGGSHCIISCSWAGNYIQKQLTNGSSRTHLNPASLRSTELKYVAVPSVEAVEKNSRLIQEPFRTRILKELSEMNALDFKRGAGFWLKNSLNPNRKICHLVFLQPR